MQSDGTSITKSLLPILDPDNAQHPTILANPAPTAKTVMPLTASEAGINVIPANTTVPYV